MAAFEPSTVAIAKIAEQYGAASLEKANEATTRLRVIDVVLFDALGWDKTYCVPEQPVGENEKGFLDYSLVHDGEEYVVAEAKRAGKTFHVPPEKTQREYKLETVLGFCGTALREVISQVQEYGVKRGIPFAVATNGRQWLVFKPYIEGKPWTSGKVIIFRDLADVKENWSTFYALLSPQAVASGQLALALQTLENKTPKFARSYNQLRGADSSRGFNALAQPFNVLFRQVFDQITDDERMLRTCYVPTDSSRNYQNEFATLLQKARPHFLPEEAGTVLKAGEPSRHLVDTLRIQGQPCVIVLVGNVGVGKTTFLHHFLRVHLVDTSADTVYAFIKDLKDESAASASHFDATQVEREIYEGLLSDIEKRFPEINPYDYDVLRRIFSHELVRLKTGGRKREFEGNKDAFLKAEADELSALQKDPKQLATGLLRYVKLEKKAPLCIAFDNVDRASEAFQQFIYSLSHRLATQAHCIVVITMRQSVYESAREGGFLDVRNDLVFMVAPPGLQQVISRRIKHARTLLVGNRISASRGLAGTDVSLLEGYLEVINELVLGDADDVRRMLEALSAGNIRKAFDFLQRFATSGQRWTPLPGPQKGSRKRALCSGLGFLLYLNLWTQSTISAAVVCSVEGGAGVGPINCGWL